MKYYLVKKTNINNEVLDLKAYTDMRSARRSMTCRFIVCYKHKRGQEDAPCTCVTFSLFNVTEKLLDKKEYGNV